MASDQHLYCGKHVLAVASTGGHYLEKIALSVDGERIPVRVPGAATLTPADWYTGGRGPRAVAYTILRHAFDAATAQALAADFERDVLASLPAGEDASWQLTTAQLHAWRQAHAELHAFLDGLLTKLATPRAPQVPLWAEPEAVAPDAPKPRVVVVDDEPGIVEVVCEVLADAAIEAVPWQDGATAYSCIRETRPTAVILDVQMPGANGAQVFALLRADPLTQDIPVIFCTANAHSLRRWVPDYRERGARLLAKPFEVDTLLGLVRQTLAA